MLELLRDPYASVHKISLNTGIKWERVDLVLKSLHRHRLYEYNKNRLKK